MRSTSVSTNLLFLVLAQFICSFGWSIETLSYRLVSEVEGVEIRSYSEHLLATVNTESGFNRAGYSAFGDLFDYISGNNQDKQKIAMTAPVIQSPTEKGWAVSFVMPEMLLSRGMPEPQSNQVIQEKIESRLMAAVQYSGSWRESKFLKHKDILVKTIKKTDYRICGPILWARYNPPFSLPFMRRNEVIAQVCKGAIVQNSELSSG